MMKPHEQSENIEQILESAVVANWPDLMRGGQSDLLHVEYGCTPAGTLDHLQVWSSKKRGYWLLACTYSMSPSKTHDIGVHFDNGYKSHNLGHILGVVMEHQNLFGLPHNFGGQGLLQIATPTETEIKAATASVSDALDRVNSLAKQKP